MMQGITRKRKRNRYISRWKLIKREYKNKMQREKMTLVWADIDIECSVTIIKCLYFAVEA
jgi:hypothetical protein